jgi:putative acetyltransferase
MIIRTIEHKDNAAVAEIVRSVLLELGAPKVGTAYEDPSVDAMFETYQKPDAVYFVVENIGKIIGGGGIDKLENGEESICELQKMYFLPEARGLGIGKKMIALCLENAKALGFKKCYLETMPFMKDAQKLYTKTGFYNLAGPLGNTGHNYCSIWMMKDL